VPINNLKYLGHAGWLVEGPDFRCICDPWFGPSGAFFSQWLPFPSNRDLWHKDLLEDLDFIYISHAHEDHLDPWVLQQADRSTTILIPKFKDPVLRSTLGQMGFSDVRELTRHDTQIFKDVKITIVEDDGYMDQDSCLLLDDGNRKILNLNDCHLDYSIIKEHIGDVDVLLLQATSAIWWPCTYDYDEQELKDKCIQKRNNAVQRAIKYALTVNAKLTVPNAGPPFFRNRALHHWNNTRREASNPFILSDDASHLMNAQGVDAQTLCPGDEVKLAKTIETIVDSKKFTTVYNKLPQYIDRYARQVQDEYPIPSYTKVEHAKMVQKFVKHVNNICKISQVYAPQLTFNVLFSFNEVEDIVVDFSQGIVEPLKNQKISYEFTLCPDSMCELFKSRYVDFERFFLGTNFKCHRDPDVYNEILFTLLKNFDIKRLLISEKIYAERKDFLNETYELEYNKQKYKVQRYCPHMLADLKKSGYVNEAGNLVCSLHGWEFDLKSGACLTNQNCPLEVKKI